MFIKTKDQINACKILNQYKHVFLYGGARSGKTFLIIRNIILRALKTPSNHLICRYRFNHAKNSLWYGTIPQVLKICFPGLKVKFDKVDWYMQIDLGNNNFSRIWLGGIDDKDRVEKILGNEYSTIYANECSQINYGGITTLRTRLAEKTILQNKFFYDCNPPSQKHWCYQELILKIIPFTHDKSILNIGSMLMNPTGNLDNLPSDYIEELQSLPEREKQRFLYGKFLLDIAGALWTYEMISWANAKEKTEAIKTIVAVDPSTTSNPGNDECGIVVCSIDDNGNGIVEADRTPTGSVRPKEWAKAVIKAYHDYDANYIVAESNQGGEMVREVIEKYQGNSHMKIKLVHASKGKFARAEPISVLYEKGMVAHRKPLLDLEQELTETIFHKEKSSPNRMDALVWGFTELFKIGHKIHLG
jgi:PBSX family phage terminase large subunit